MSRHATLRALTTLRASMTHAAASTSASMAQASALSAPLTSSSTRAHIAWAPARTFASGLTIDGGVTSAYEAVPESVVLVSDDRKPVIDPESGLDVARKAVYGVVQIRSHQFKVSPDDLILVDKIKGVDINDVVSLPRVLMLGNKDRTVIGRPTVPGAEVLALVEEQVRDGKKIIFKKKRRKNYRRSNGYRAQLTGLRVLEINGIEEA